MHTLRARWPASPDRVHSGQPRSRPGRRPRARAFGVRILGRSASFAPSESLDSRQDRPSQGRPPRPFCAVAPRLVRAWGSRSVGTGPPLLHLRCAHYERMDLRSEAASLRWVSRGETPALHVSRRGGAGLHSPRRGVEKRNSSSKHESRLAGSTAGSVKRSAASARCIRPSICLPRAAPSLDR